MLLPSVRPRPQTTGRRAIEVKFDGIRARYASTGSVAAAGR
jgi:hypothetical protein